jgi:hypothetical protein
VGRRKNTNNNTGTLTKKSTLEKRNSYAQVYNMQDRDKACDFYVEHLRVVFFFISNFLGGYENEYDFGPKKNKPSQYKAP